MSFKTYLQTLLGRFYSKQESAEVAKLALPAGSGEISQQLASSENDQIFVAPCNGYAVVTSNEGTVNTIVLECHGVRQTISFGSIAWLSTQIPVVKGANVSARIYPTSATLKFIPLIGGGASRALVRVLRGGALWLRLRVCLTRFHAARPLLLSKGKTSKTLASRVQQLRLSLHLTDLLLLSRQDTRTRMQSILVAEVCKFLHLATLVRGLSCGFLAERDLTLQSESTEVHRRIRFYGASRLDLSSNALHQEVTYGFA